MDLWPYAAMMGAQFFCGLGLPPLPEEAVVIAAAVVTGSNNLQPLLAWPACIIGILLADLVLYGIGRFGRSRLFRYRWVNRFLPPGRRERIDVGFARHGVKIMMTSRLLPGVRTGVFIMAGAVHYPFIRFLVADGLFLVFGVGFFFFGGYYFSEAITNLVNNLHSVQDWVITILVPFVIGYLVYIYLRHWRNRKQADELDPVHLLHDTPKNSPEPAATPESQV